MGYKDNGAVSGAQQGALHLGKPMQDHEGFLCSPSPVHVVF